MGSRLRGSAGTSPPFPLGYNEPMTGATSLATTIAVTIALAGISLIVSAPGPLQSLVGYGLVGFGSSILLIAIWRERRTTTTSQRKLKRATSIIHSLRAQGDRLFSNPGIVSVATASGGCDVFMVVGSTQPPSPLEQWRETVGNKLNHPPFKPGTGDWALTQHGNRFSDVLGNLRDIEANLENWISKD